MHNANELTPDEFNGHVTFDGALYILGISKKEFRELVRNGLPVGSDEALSPNRVHDSSIFWATEGAFSYFNVGNIVNFYGENLPQEEKNAVIHRAKLASKIDSGFVVKVLGEGKERTLRFYRVIDDGREELASAVPPAACSEEEAPATEEAGPERHMPSPAAMLEMHERDPKTWGVQKLGDRYWPRQTKDSRRVSASRYLREAREDRERK
ncbi:MAG: hypothetical protein AB1916_03065 [Thermodesulfobacteriota bacterium]